MRQIRILLSTCLSIFIILSLTLGQFWLPLQAQDANKPVLRITDINIDAFPQVEVSVYGQNLGDPLASIPLRLEEGNTEQEIESDFRNVGVQVAIVIDASRNIRSAGITGDPRNVEIANVTRAFLDLGVLSSETDWLSSHTIAPGSEGFQTLTDWTQDHNAVANGLFQYTPSDNQPTTTSLFGLIKFAMDRFDDTGIAANVQKQIVIFSDGSDVVSALERDDITNRADNSNITINTVLIGNDNFRDAADNLRRIATLTRGNYTQLEDVSSLNGLWQEIAEQRGQRILTYRTDNPEPGTVEVIAQRPDGREITHEVDFPRPSARPPRVIVLQPESERIIVREADSPDMPLEEMTEGSLSIEVAFEWPDGYEREPVRVEYHLNNRLLPVEEPPFDRFDISIAELAAGDYTLLVRAADELGLIGESQAVPFTVELNIPEPQPESPAEEQPEQETDEQPESEQSEPEQPVEGGENPPESGTTITDTQISTGTAVISPTVPTTITVPPNNNEDTTEVPGQSDSDPTLLDRVATRVMNAVEQTTGTTLSRNAALLLALFPFIILLFGLTYLLRRRQPAPTYDPYELEYTELGSSNDFSTQAEYTEPAADPFSADDDYTEPAQLPNFDVIPPAHLIYVDGGDELPPTIPIDGGREIRIGRKDSFCDRVIDDRRISRLHATIVERADGFYIRDEGSAGGTFVNRRKLGVSDNQPLKDGDIVNLNAIAYRFELTKDDANDDDDKTEPAITPDLDSTQISNS